MNCVRAGEGEETRSSEEGQFKQRRDSGGGAHERYKSTWVTVACDGCPISYYTPIEPSKHSPV